MTNKGKKKYQKAASEKVKDMDYPWVVVEKGLCVRCGACVDLCPKSLLRLDGYYYPWIDDIHDRCNLCGLCKVPCPGAEMNLPAFSLSLFDDDNSDQKILGIYKYPLIGYSVNESVRNLGSAGGMVTQILLTLLSSGIIEAALVAGMSGEEPWKGEPVLACSRDQIMACSQSKYTVVPQMKYLGEIVRSRKNIAIVGLPCHIHAFRKFQAKYPEKVSNVKLVIGLFCHMAIEIEGTEKMLECAEIKKKDLDRIEYRGGKWPGKVRAVLKNGETKPLHHADFKDGAINYLKYLYYPKRCMTCLDFSAELSDLSVGDPWFRNRDGSYVYRGGHSLILVRTKRAEKLLNMVVNRGSAVIEPINKSLLRPRFIGMYKHKKIGAQIRIRALKNKGCHYPNYHTDEPHSKLSDKITEGLSEMMRILGKSEKGRNLGSLLAFSSFGKVLNTVRKARKEFIARFQYR